MRFSLILTVQFVWHLTDLLMKIYSFSSQDSLNILRIIYLLKSVRAGIHSSSLTMVSRVDNIHYELMLFSSTFYLSPVHHCRLYLFVYKLYLSFLIVEKYIRT